MTDLYEICEAIKGHLPEECRDNLRVVESGLDSFDEIVKIMYDDLVVLGLYEDGTFDNNWYNWNRSDNLNIKFENIFEEVGDDLTEIKVKPVENVETKNSSKGMTDLYEICEAIKKHLPEECRDKLGVEQYDDHSGDIIYDDWGVVSMFEDGTFDNDWINWIDYSELINFELEDIFEEVGGNLTEIKVKPVENVEKEAMCFPKHSDFIITDTVTDDELGFDISCTSLASAGGVHITDIPQISDDYNIQSSSPMSSSIFDCQSQSCNTDILLFVNIVKTTGDEMKDIAKRLYGSEIDGYAYSGMYVKMHNTIYLNAEMTMCEACRTVKHEIGHYTLDKIMSGAVVVNEETMCDLLALDMFMSSYNLYSNLATTYIAQNWEEL